MPAYNKLTEGVAEELRRAVGPGRFFSGAAVKEQYSHECARPHGACWA